MVDVVAVATDVAATVLALLLLLRTGVAATIQPAAPDPSGTISVCANVSVWFANQLATKRAIGGGVVESTTECSLQEVTDRGFVRYNTSGR